MHVSINRYRFFVSIFRFRIHLETTENAFVDVVNKDNSKTQVIANLFGAISVLNDLSKYDNLNSFGLFTTELPVDFGT